MHKTFNSIMFKKKQGQEELELLIKFSTLCIQKLFKANSVELSYFIFTIHNTQGSEIWIQTQTGT